MTDAFNHFFQSLLSLTHSLLSLTHSFWYSLSSFKYPGTLALFLKKWQNGFGLKRTGIRRNQGYKLHALEGGCLLRKQAIKQLIKRIKRKDKFLYYFSEYIFVYYLMDPKRVFFLYNNSVLKSCGISQASTS